MATALCMLEKFGVRLSGPRVSNLPLPVGGVIVHGAPLVPQLVPGKLFDPDFLGKLCLLNFLDHLDDRFGPRRKRSGTSPISGFQPEGFSIRSRSFGLHFPRWHGETERKVIQHLCRERTSICESLRFQGNPDMLF